MNPYSELFNPGKYFAYTRRPEQTTCLVIAEDNEAVIKIIKKARSMALRHLSAAHSSDRRSLVVRSLFESKSAHEACKCKTASGRLYDKAGE